MNRRLLQTLIACLSVTHLFAATTPTPLRALLITGGCCHDYSRQKQVLKQGIEARANVEVDVVYTDDQSTSARFDLYKNPNWAAPYDVVIHDECSADIKDMPYVRNILNAHKTIPAVNLHCAMHCYRTGTDDWFEFVGIQSTGHGPQLPIDLQYIDTSHEITQPLANWTTINEELYNNVRIFDTAHPLALGRQTLKKQNGSEQKVETVVAWINNYGKTRVFSTTLGHNTETVGDDRYLNLVTRGMLWACEQLNDNYLKTEASVIRQVNLAKNKPATASSEESSKQNFARKAVDGNSSSRWCANGPGENQWLQVDLGEPTQITSTSLDWEMADTPYRYKIEGSLDGQAWNVLVDASQNTSPGPNEDHFETETRHLRVTYLGKPSGGWASIYEFAVFGEQTETVDPRQARAEEDQKFLGDTQIPEGFTATVFAAPPMANYPVFVAAAPNGTLFVSSDGNGSLDRNPHRGRVLRLRDLNGDGRADEVKEFVPDVDSPRGLVWDHDRVYLMHPPNLSAFIDHDGDGVADEEQVLVKGIAFGFKDRPADHTSNGVTLGIDGWLYCAIGDFGFMQAVDRSGRTLQLRGGGVVRVRPDGTGLELFARGTRNILETPANSLLDLFARDNTNDGGGWDIRFHHFTGLEEHGYPTLFKNFSDEIIQPLADYGGGSGCGAAWIDEPGIPTQWNNAAFTADWGRNWIYHHSLQPNGATFTVDQTEFFAATRVTDLDADALSHIYIASWKGATFTWAGPEVGYIVQLSPKDYQPAPLPDIDDLDNPRLINLLESTSARRRLAAQRALLRNGLDQTTTSSLLTLAGDITKPLASRVAAVFAIKQGLGSNATTPLLTLASDPTIQAWILRALTDQEEGLPQVPSKPFLHALQSPDARTRKEAVVGIARLNNPSLAPALLSLLADTDPVVSHTTVQALKRLHAIDACLAAVDEYDANSPQRIGALRVLQSIHEPAVADQLIARLQKENQPARRRGLLTALCRLHFTDAEWTGNSWGTRPDTSGPIYQPVKWSATPRIEATLQKDIRNASPAETAFLARELDRHKIRMNDAVEAVVALASQDPSQLPLAIQTLKTADALPDTATPLLIAAATNQKMELQQRSDALLTLTRADQDLALEAIFTTIRHITPPSIEEPLPLLRNLGNALAASPHANSRLPAIIHEAQQTGPSALLAKMVLIRITERKNSSPEAVAAAQTSLQQSWENPSGQIQLLTALAAAQASSYKDKILTAAADSNPSVRETARAAAKALRIELPTPATNTADDQPIGDMEVDAVVQTVMNMRGDIAQGEKIFTQQACILCHTTSTTEPPRGPFLGNIANTYKRKELAENILMPNKSLAQGFVGNHFELNDGTEYDGFVTLEAAEQVTIRNVAGQEILIPVKDIALRTKLENSIMPEGIVANLTPPQFASLLDYLEALAQQN